jgi:hypothetical protein
LVQIRVSEGEKEIFRFSLGSVKGSEKLKRDGRRGFSISPTFLAVIKMRMERKGTKLGKTLVNADAKLTFAMRIKKLLNGSVKKTENNVH